MYKENATQRHIPLSYMTVVVKLPAVNRVPCNESRSRSSRISGRHLGEDDGVELPQRLGEQVAVDEDKRVHRSQNAGQDLRSVGTATQRKSDAQE